MWKKITVKYNTDTLIDYDTMAKYKYIPKPGFRYRHPKKVFVYSLEGTYIKSYESVQEAGVGDNISESSVSHIIRGRRLYSKKTGRIYLDVNESIEERLECINKKSKK